ncbi:MAG: hypothetical protein JOS17DRAFT_416552 [Linnemannia elongata]|nr:MAG: hypothetical protein JOS17DRAFT_416552 [Linnemannia elongata]
MSMPQPSTIDTAFSSVRCHPQRHRLFCLSLFTPHKHTLHTHFLSPFFLSASVSSYPSTFLSFLCVCLQPLKSTFALHNYCHNYPFTLPTQLLFIHPITLPLHLIPWLRNQIDNDSWTDSSNTKRTRPTTTDEPIPTTPTPLFLHTSHLLQHFSLSPTLLPFLSRTLSLHPFIS